jgi:serine/threonine protein kinase
MINDANREFFLQLLEQRGLNGTRFDQIERLDAHGGGGMFSLMFRAVDTQLDRTVAIKVFHPERRNDAYRVACFEREEQMLAAMRGQPGIVQLTSAREHAVHSVSAGLPSALSWNFHYFGMELADSDLGSDIAAGGYDPETTLTVFRDLCKPIQRLHRGSITHRDLKPSNCLRFKRGVIKVADLGVARNLAERPLVSDYGIAWPGDYRYAPPEMIAGLFAENASLAYLADFFALGSIFFEMWTGATLTVQVYEPGLVNDLMTTMAHVPLGKRQHTLDGFVAQLAPSRQLPSMADFGAAVPRCIRYRLDHLYQALCALDYRQRLNAFPSVFRQIEAALIVLRNEEKYRKWMQEKRRRRAIAISTGRLRR